MKSILQLTLLLLVSISLNSQNLVQNGSAEEFPIYDNGWTFVVGDFTSRLAETSSQEGDRYFYANQSSVSEIYQEIDLSSMIAEVDAGQKSFRFSCYFRSFTAGLDESQAIVEYLDDNDNVLSTYNTGPVISPTGWIEYSDIRVAPIGTRTIKITLIATKNFGNNNDGYIDNVALEDISDVTIPDPNFEQALINDNIDSDGIINGKVLLSDVINLDFLDVSSESISDLTGLEYFFDLISLIADNNNISTIDISNNTQLTSIVVNSNQLTAIDVIENTNLVSLIVSDNLFTDLDISSNQNITQLFADNNQLGFIDLSQSILLEQLSISGNTISDLVLSLNPNLQFVDVSNNDLVYLNIRNGNSMSITNENFITTGNSNLNCITVDDVTYSTTTWTNVDAQTSFAIDCIASNQNNLLYNGSAEIVPVIGNGWTQVIGNTTGRLTQSIFLDGLRYFYANQSPFAELYQDINLSAFASEIDSGLKSYTFSCYFQSFDQITPDDSRALLEYKDINGNVLESYDTGYSSIVSIWTKFEDVRLAPIGTRSVRVTLFQQRTSGINNDGYIDDVVFQESPVVFIPDPNFEQALIDQGIDTDGVINTEVKQSDIIDIFSLNVSSSNISDLTGIEGFLALDALFAFDNNLTSVDLSENRDLNILVLTANNLEAINLANNTNIVSLDLSQNELTDIDLSNNTLITQLSLNDNQLSSLTLDNLSSLAQFSVADNAIVELDLTEFSSLNQLFCQNNNLVNLNVQNGNNSNVNSNFFDATGNPNLLCIQVDDAAYSTITWENKDSQSFYGLECNPINDGCDEASTLTLGDIVLGSTFSATSSDFDPSCQQEGIVLIDVWYEFVAPFSGSVTASTGSSALNDVKIAVYEDCNASEPIACGTGGIQIDNLIQGETYLVQIWVEGSIGSRSLDTVVGDFELTIQDSSTLSNTSFGSTENELKVYPNPAKDEVTISSNQIIDGYQILDITGKVVLSNSDIQTLNHAININSLSKGIYLMKIKAENASVTKKLIIK